MFKSNLNELLLRISEGESEKFHKTYMRFFTDYMKMAPVPENFEILENRVKQVVEVKTQSPIPDTTALEAEIDRLVYELYGLTEEEIKIVEESVR